MADGSFVYRVGGKHHSVRVDADGVVNVRCAGVTGVGVAGLWIIKDDRLRYDQPGSKSGLLETIRECFAADEAASKEIGRLYLSAITGVMWLLMNATTLTREQREGITWEQSDRLVIHQVQVENHLVDVVIIVLAADDFVSTEPPS